MLRTALRASLRPLCSPQHAQRSFVSTVLLSTKYENKTVAQLRTELRARGLSASGSKAAMITRIQRADAVSVTEAGSSAPMPPTPSQSPRRNVSNSSASHEEAPPSVVPRSSVPLATFDIKIPDVSQPPAEQSVQIPFVPDFWDSSIKKAEEAAAETIFEPSVPKIMLAAGASTHPAGGPTYALSPAPDTLPSPDPPASPKQFNGLIGDFLDDLTIPRNVLSASPVSTDAPRGLAAKRSSARPLDEEEVKGAWKLLGLFLGGWIVAGLAAPPASKSKKKGTEKSL